MLGWELPPLQIGGLGMICYELVKELSIRKVPITYIMPMGPEDTDSEFANLIIAENDKLGKNIKFPEMIRVPAFFTAYQSPENYSQSYKDYISKRKNNLELTKKQLYGPFLSVEVDLYAKRVYNIIDKLNFDIIHAHDWITYPAAIGIAEKTGKPLVVHIHNTIFDRYLGNASSWERDIEYNGLKRADLIIAISNYVKNTLIEKYGISPDKIRVVYNAKNTMINNLENIQAPNFVNKKIVLFTGRITVQKGVEYLIQAAKKVLEKRKDILFVIMGGGDKQYFEEVVNLVASLGISKNVIFTGKPYSLQEAKSLYKIADCYVMPSVSEPFGIVPMEAMEYDTPCIISKQSGCAEVLKNTLKVDFWDIDELANKILSVLSYDTLNKQMSQQGKIEVEKMTWKKAVDKLINIYTEAINMKNKT